MVIVLNLLLCHINNPKKYRNIDSTFGSIAKLDLQFLVTTVDGVVCSSCHDGRDGEEEDGVGGNCRLQQKFCVII
jgi:hypothetical protein